MIARSQERRTVISAMGARETGGMAESVGLGSWQLGGPGYPATWLREMLTGLSEPSTTTGWAVFGVGCCCANPKLWVALDREGTGIVAWELAAGIRDMGYGIWDTNGFSTTCSTSSTN